MTLEGAVDKMRGPVNSKIKLRIMRKGRRQAYRNGDQTRRYSRAVGAVAQAKGIVPDIEVVQDVPKDIATRTEEMRGESSLHGHLKADGEEQNGSQSYVPPEAKDDKALNFAVDLLRGVQSNSAVLPNANTVDVPH